MLIVEAPAVEDVVLKVYLQIDRKFWMVKVVGQIQMVKVVEPGTSALETVVNCLTVLLSWRQKLKRTTPLELTPCVSKIQLKLANQ